MTGIKRILLAAAALALAAGLCFGLGAAGAGVDAAAAGVGHAIQQGAHLPALGGYLGKAARSAGSSITGQLPMLAPAIDVIKGAFAP